LIFFFLGPDLLAASTVTPRLENRGSWASAPIFSFIRPDLLVAATVNSRLDNRRSWGLREALSSSGTLCTFSHPHQVRL
jgi:hypothetical protein